MKGGVVTILTVPYFDGTSNSAGEEPVSYKYGDATVVCNILQIYM
jgi:hypothetical protein